MRKIWCPRTGALGPQVGQEVCAIHPVCQFHMVRRFSEALRITMEEEGAGQDRERHVLLMSLAFRAMSRLLVAEIAGGTLPDPLGGMGNPKPKETPDGNGVGA